ncbi:putative RNA-binding protein 15B [Pithys albifrons albifrons]|uniref:putative RNA-binding protein 15B n=1 Tax=Pithys albifrons albifrons TaxID=3385563 RepID=UPI003A5D1211
MRDAGCGRDSSPRGRGDTRAAGRQQAMCRASGGGGERAPHTHTHTETRNTRKKKKQNRKAPGMPEEAGRGCRTAAAVQAPRRAPGPHGCAGNAGDPRTQRPGQGRGARGVRARQQEGSAAGAMAALPRTAERSAGADPGTARSAAPEPSLPPLLLGQLCPKAEGFALNQSEPWPAAAPGRCDTEPVPAAFPSHGRARSHSIPCPGIGRFSKPHPVSPHDRSHQMPGTFYMWDLTSRTKVVPELGLA